MVVTTRLVIKWKTTENSRHGHHVRQRLTAQLSEAGMDVEIEKLHTTNEMRVSEQLSHHCRDATKINKPLLVV